LSAHDERKKRLKREWLLTFAIAFSLLGFLICADIARPLGNVVYDHLMRLHGFRATQDIVIVSIDERSLSELGGWPLKRSQYTNLLKKLDDDRYRPKVIGFDLLFLDATPDDLDLANSMQALNTVLPLEFKIQEDAHQTLKPTLPVEPLASSTTIGHINLSFDPDGVIRGIQTQAQDWPQFALALHAKGSPNVPPNASSVGYRRFRMVDPRIGFPMVSLSDAINNNVTRSLLKDKYVLVGVTTPSLGDRYPTLYSGKNNASTPGVAILASVLNASLHNALIEEASAFVVFGLSSALLLMMLQSLVLLRPRQSLILALVMLFCSTSFSYALLVLYDYWIDPVPFIVVAILLQPLWAWRRLEAIVSLVEDKAADLQQFQPSERSSTNIKHSREVVLQYAKLLDHAVASARSELDFLSAVIDEMPDAVAIFDPQDQLLLGNRKLLQLVGEHATIIGQSMSDLAHQLNLPLNGLSNGFIATNNTPSAFQLNTQMGFRDFYLKHAAIDSPLGGHLRLVILMDITELKQSQTQRDRALQFLSHDMRTPIASILSVTRKNAGSTETGTQREKIIHHAKALLQMMDDFILTISAEAPEYKFKQILLDDLLNDAIERVADVAEEKGISLQDTSETSSVFVMANTQLLVRALVNLLFNAVKFSPNNSTIAIKVTSTEEGSAQSPLAIITIHNHVIITPDAHDLTPSMQGFGLGLDFVDTVIRKHKGSITRDIPLNGMATISITIPCEKI
jgi:CHASE2 domain-containing sensor protein